MTTITRRRFLGQTVLGLGALALPFQELLTQARAVNLPLGFQTYPVRDLLAKDFTGTLKMMAAQGYRLTEMCSPKGYEKIGFGSLVAIQPPELRRMIEDTGLECPSCHFGFGELTDHLDERIEFAKGLGLSQMICSTFWLPKTATLDDYRAAADRLNQAAEKIKKAGMQAGFHNHSFEFVKLDGQLIYDVLLDRLDPGLVKMQFQTEVINLGYKASTYFEKYPGRFISAHLSDWTQDKKQVPVGRGIIDWKEFFEAAQTGGVQNFFVETDLDNMKESVAYLQTV